MAKLDFPGSPTPGTKYPAPPVAGQPVYTWDGEKWSGTATPVIPTITVSDSPPVGAADGTLWWESDSGLLYLRFNDGTSTQWVIASPQPDFSSYLTTNAQTFNAAQQQQVRQNIYAAPFDALAYSGMQINGGMEVSQEVGGAAVSITPQDTYKYVVDGWKAATHTTSGTVIFQQTAGGLIGGNYFPFVLGYFNNSAVVSGSGDYVMVSQFIEGYRVAKLGWGTASAQPITISFSIYSVTPGHASLAVRNASNNRSYVADVVVSAAATWEYKTVTVPGDTTGTWAKDNTSGLSLTFTYAGGATFQTPTSLWVSGNFFATTLQNNLTPGVNIYLTGVTVLPGSEAPSAARSPFIMRPYDQELVTCRRYYQRLGGLGTADVLVQGTSTLAATTFSTTLTISPTMRIAPTTTEFGTWSKINITSTVFYPATSSIGWQVNIPAIGFFSSYGNTGGLSLDARL